MSNEKILFDAETDATSEEINKEQSVVYDCEKENNNEQNGQGEYKIDENQPNVFTKGMNGGKFIVNHHCPVCLFTKKNIRELFTRKRFSRNKKVVGYMATCANCGHVDFYTDNPDALIAFFQGKII